MVAHHYPPTHPLSVIAKEFGYKNGNSAQASMWAAGYRGPVKLMQMRAFLKRWRARLTGAAGKTDAAPTRRRRSQALTVLAQQRYPGLRYRAYARNKIRLDLKAVGYKGRLDNMDKMSAALGQQPTLAALPAPAASLPVATNGETDVSVVTPDPRDQAVKDLKHLKAVIREVLSIHERIEMLYHGVPRKRGDPLLGLCDYNLGILRGEIPV